MTIQSQGANQIPGQLKMFMTPHEIMESHQGLDADRMEENEYGEESARTWSGSQSYTGGSGYTYNTQGNYARRSEGGTRYSPRRETLDEMWGRKLDEAQGHETYGGSGKYVAGSQPSRWTQTEGGGSDYVPGSEETTLHESIGRHGVTHPVRLGSETGSEGQPQIVGGHHRLASALEHAESGTWGHQFLPVLHHKNIYEARSKPTTAAYKYT